MSFDVTMMMSRKQTTRRNIQNETSFVHKIYSFKSISINKYSLIL